MRQTGLDKVGLRSTQRRELFALLAPAVLALFLLTIFPSIFAINVAVRDYDISKVRHVGAPFVGGRNFAYVIHDPEFWNSVKVTALFSLLCLAIELPLGLLAAYVFNKERPKLLSGLKILILLPMALAPSVVALVFRWFYSSEVGLLNYVLQAIGLPAPAWGSNAWAALFSVVIADVWEWTPFVFLICLAGLQSIDKELYEAAEVDGATEWKKFWSITMPQLRPTLILVLLLRFIPAIKEFDKPFIITGGGPGISTETVSIYIYKRVYWYNHMGTAVAAAFLLLVIIIILSQVTFAVMRRYEEW